MRKDEHFKVYTRIYQIRMSPDPTFTPLPHTQKLPLSEKILTNLVRLVSESERHPTWITKEMEKTTTIPVLLYLTDPANRFGVGLKITTDGPPQSGHQSGVITVRRLSKRWIEKCLSGTRSRWLTRELNQFLTVYQVGFLSFNLEL